MKSVFDEDFWENLSSLSKLSIGDFKKESMVEGIEEMLRLMEILDTVSLDKDVAKEVEISVVREDESRDSRWKNHFLSQAPVKKEDMLEVASSLEV